MNWQHLQLISAGGSDRLPAGNPPRRMPDANHVKRFGVFALDLRSRELLKNGRKVRLQEQPFQVLAALLEHPGEVVPRQELRQRLWPANVFVDFDNGLSIAVAKLRQVLHDSAARPRYIETLPRLGYRFVGQLEEPKEPAEATAAPTKTKLRADGLALGLILSGVLVWLAIWTSFVPWPVWLRQRPLVAVVGRDAAAAKLAELLSDELEASGRVRTVPGEGVAGMKRDLALPEADGFSNATLARMRRYSGADYAAVISLAASGGALSLDLRVQDTRTGETEVALPATGAEGDLHVLAAKETSGILSRLIPGFTRQAATGTAGNALQAEAGSEELYINGLEKLRNFDAQGARDQLERAVAEDPNYSLAHAALATAWSNLGYAVKAREEARKAWNLAARLPRERQLPFAATYHELSMEWDKAIQAYTSLLELFPDNPAYGLSLARAQVSASKFSDALSTVDRMRRLPVRLRDAPAAAIDYWESRAQEGLGNFENARRAAERAAKEARERQQLALTADARAQECAVLIERSLSQEAATACERAMEIRRQAGDRAGLANAKGYLAAVRFNQGDLAAAQELYSEALEIHRELGNQAGMLWQSNGLATVMLREDRLDEALQHYQASLRISRATGSRDDEADALENSGTVWMVEGNLARAQDAFRQALARYRETKDQAGSASALNNLAQVSYWLGDLQGATRMLTEAQGIDASIGYLQDQADTLLWLGRVHLARAEIGEAQRDFSESVHIAEQTNIPVFAATCRLAGAAVPLEAGRPAEAEGAIRREAEFFEKHQLVRQDLEARTMLIQSLQAQGKTADAAREAAKASPLEQASRRPAVRMAFAIQAARVNASARDLEAIAAQASRLHMTLFQLETRKALAEVELGSGRASEARHILQKLEGDARARGFEAIARQAGRLKI